MTQTARTIGGPGAGKTTRALTILSMVLDRIVQDPFQVGFVSFTRAARREASTRAGEKFGVKPADLERLGYFRTLHSIAYKHLDVRDGQLLTGTRQDNEWAAAALGGPVTLAKADTDDDAMRPSPEGGRHAAALALWDAARNRQCPVGRVWARLVATDLRTPGYEEVLRTISHYERAKEADDRLDFTDLLMRYAGSRFTGDADRPFAEVEPEGTLNPLPVWFFDEAQDVSVLSAAVFRRLSRHSQYVYLMGDNYQEIYSWCGSDGKVFASWPVQKEEVLPVSHRCRANVLACAHALMARGGHPDRGFTARHDGGEVVRGRKFEAALAAVRPGEDVLVLCRTNQQAQYAAAQLDDALVPWRPTKGPGGYDAPARAAGVAALDRLRRGQEIDGEALWRLLAITPTRLDDGTVLWERGTKAWFDEKKNRQDLLPVGLALIDAVGGTEALKRLVSHEHYPDHLLDDPRCHTMARCARAHGPEALLAPRCRVGTVHSAKGMECDTAVVYNSMPPPTAVAVREHPDCREEERRVWYVAATRARHRLVLCEGHDPYLDL